MKCYSSAKEVVYFDFSVGDDGSKRLCGREGLQLGLEDDLVLTGRQTSCGEFQVGETTGQMP